MKLRILSDLHLDHRRGRFELEEVEHDVLVCVGDVRGSITDGIEVLGSTSGPMGSTCAPVWKTTSNASSS